MVIFTYDPSYADRFWLLRDYLPKLGVCTAVASRRSRTARGTGEEVRVETWRSPTIAQGLLAAYWRRRGYLASACERHTDVSAARRRTLWTA